MFVVESEQGIVRDIGWVIGIGGHFVSRVAANVRLYARMRKDISDVKGLGEEYVRVAKATWDTSGIRVG